VAAEYDYIQAFDSLADRNRVPADGLAGASENRRPQLINYLRELRTPPPPALCEWTEQQLRRLAGQPRSGLRPEDLAAPPTDAVALSPANAERVARALEALLADSGEYTYTMDSPPLDQAEPVLDFLRGVKRGHCQHFASALALMLRARGVPARLVRGYRGADPLDQGVYVVRQLHAHSWVEALVPRGDGGYDWLTLEPTPGGAAPPAPGLDSWWTQGGEVLWRDLIVGYSSRRQADLWSRLTAELSTGPGLLRALGWLALVVGIVGLVSVGRVLWRRRRWLALASAPGARGYFQLLEILRRQAGLRPQPGQTPREFAEAAAAWLRQRPHTAPFAHLPGHVVEAYYRARFGGMPPALEEEQALNEELGRLAVAAKDGQSSKN
jgi:hypothetical protein